jgi:ABC-2 type transport system ATP-binding protein
VSTCIQVRNLSKIFPVAKTYRELLFSPFRHNTVTALRGIDLTIEKGDLFGLLGSNGAGKTTLIKILCTLVLPTKGSASIDGLDVCKNPEKIKPKLGYVIGDERSFYWRLTGRQNLRFFAVLSNIPQVQIDKRVSSLLDIVGLNGHGDKMFKEYSTGMKKMLAIARGMLTNPDILIMDEPTSDSIRWFPGRSKISSEAHW